mgnify:CR=1 FL=1
MNRLNGVMEIMERENIKPVYHSVSVEVLDIMGKRLAR